MIKNKVKVESRFSFVEEEITMADIKIKSKYIPDPAIIDIFNRLKYKGIEEPMKYSFNGNVKAAGAFRSACVNYRAHLKLLDFVHIGLSESTVYIYNKAEWISIK